jgi:tRNA(fMet)-specific endonuclease VapC
VKQTHLVDSDWSIDYLQGRADTVRRVNELVRRRKVAISIVCVAELYEGVLYSHEPAARERALKHFLRLARVLPLDREVARIFGRERGRLRKAKKVEEVGDLDILIAATALRHNLTLLTNNRDHFEPFQGLRLESLR